MEGEISISTDDIICNVKPVDDGWSLGTAPDGQRGMLPSENIQLLLCTYSDVDGARGTIVSDNTDLLQGTLFSGLQLAPLQ